MFARFLEKVSAGLKWLSQFVITVVSFVVTPILMFLMLPLVRKDPNNVLPKLLQFLNTQDDPGMDQGMHLDANGKPVPGKYEQQVKDVYDKYGWYVKTWYWLGWRNQLYTLFNWLAPEIHYTNPTYIVSNWKITTTDENGSFYFLVLNTKIDVGFGWKLFNAPGKCSFYFRPRFWKKPSN